MRSACQYLNMKCSNAVFCSCRTTRMPPNCPQISSCKYCYLNRTLSNVNVTFSVQGRAYVDRVFNCDDLLVNYLMAAKLNTSQVSKAAHWNGLSSTEHTSSTEHQTSTFESQASVCKALLAYNWSRHQGECCVSAI